jgi:hypothetical protein
MRFAWSLQSLSLPAAALAAALTLACAEAAPTAPDPTPSFAIERGVRAPLMDDDGRLNCERGYRLVASGIGDLSVYDLNGNGFICEYTGGGEGDQLYMDDGKRGCKSGYGLVEVSDGAWGKEFDFNGNGLICVLGA